VLFRQQRPGLHERPFMLVKFRTMSGAPGGQRSADTDAARLGRLGRFLRRASLDELPEFFNVLVGDMSLVGPRPLLMEYLDRYSPEQRRRHLVRPGLTGLAQISGRNDLSWEERFTLDVWYVDHWTNGLDVRILARTIIRLLTGHGVTQTGHATVEDFNPREN
jgi:lipopolysaccharide/colanic/teichoic acid biosynthesis glycosyltransferase